VGSSPPWPHRSFRPPGAVVDEELLIELLAHFLKYEPRYDVGCAAGGEYDDHAHRFHRILLRPRRAARDHDQTQSCAQQPNRIHVNLLVVGFQQMWRIKSHADRTVPVASDSDSIGVTIFWQTSTAPIKYHN
jgi:hypothetical protein